MLFQRLIKISFLALAMSLTACVTTDDDPIEDDLNATEEIGEDGEDGVDDEEYCEEDEENEEYCEEEEFADGGESDEWNGIDPDIIDEPEDEFVDVDPMDEEDPLTDVVDATLEEEEELVNNTDWVDVTEPVQPMPETLTATQGDLTLTCTPTGTQDMQMLTTRYGCKAYIRNTGEYYGVIKGWWKVTRNDGTRIPIKDLVFRDGEFDATFSVPNQDAIAGVKARPWQ